MVRAYVWCLAAFVLDQANVLENAYTQFTARLKGLRDSGHFSNPENDYDERTLFEGRQTFLAGVVEGDVARLEDGIKTILEFHDTELGKDEFSVEATALTVLARRQGYDVQIKCPYIPSALVDYDSGPDVGPD